MIRAVAVAAAVAVVVLAGCAGDEHDSPDITDSRPLGSITVPVPTATPDPTGPATPDPADPADVPGSTHGGDSPVCDASAPDASDVAACAATTGPPPASTTPASLPRCEDPDDATDPDEAPCAP